MATMTTPKDGGTLGAPEPLDDAEWDRLLALLELRKDYRAGIGELHEYILRAYGSGQMTQIEMAERGGWRHRDTLRQLLNRLRKAVLAGTPLSLGED